MYKLFLDDIRQPPDKTWIIARTYGPFVGIISHCGLPEIISFDHDLGKQKQLILRTQGYSKRKAREESKDEKTGLDCAKWLIEYCLDKNLRLPKYIVHSFNPVGKENIIALLDNFKRSQDEDYEDNSGHGHFNL